MKRVHFICRGNSFRSRLAEAYLLSKQLQNTAVLSSGTVAKEYAHINGLLPHYTKYALLHSNLMQYDKGHWDQLNSSRLGKDDTVVIFGSKAYSEFSSMNPDFQHKISVWDIPDTGELFRGVKTPSPNDVGVDQFAIENFQRIKDAIDTLIEGALYE